MNLFSRSILWIYSVGPFCRSTLLLFSSSSFLHLNLPWMQSNKFAVVPYTMSGPHYIDLQTTLWYLLFQRLFRLSALVPSFISQPSWDSLASRMLLRFPSELTDLQLSDSEVSAFLNWANNGLVTVWLRETRISVPTSLIIAFYCKHVWGPFSGLLLPELAFKKRFSPMDIHIYPYIWICARHIVFSVYCTVYSHLCVWGKQVETARNHFSKQSNQMVIY